MMYCDSCKADFSDGMTYCKWCGQVLREKRLVTTQLQKCPSCSTPVQGDWTFCNVCGANMLQAAQEPLSPICARCGAVVPFGVPNCLRCGERIVALPASQPVTAASTPAHDPSAQPATLKCGVCAAIVDKDASYCKICGAPIYSASGTHPSQFATQVHVSPVEAGTPASETPNPTQEVSNATLEISSLPTVQSDTETVVLSSATPEPPPRPPASDKKEVETLAIHSLTDAIKADDQRTAAVKDDTTTKPVSSVTAPTQQVFEEAADEIVFTIEPEKTQRVGSEATEKVTSTPPSVEESRHMHTSEPTKTYSSFTEPASQVDQPAMPSKPDSAESDTRTKVIASLPSEKSGEPAYRKPKTDELATPAPVNEPQRPPLAAGTIPFQPPVQDRTGEAFSNAPTKQISPLEPVAPPLAKAPVVEYPAHPLQPAPQPLHHPPFPSKKKSSFPVVPLILVLVIIAGAVAAIWWFALRQSESPTANVNSSSTVNANTSPTANINTNTAPKAAAPDGMVLVGAGTYTIGRDDGDDIEKPIHQVTLIAFYIDKTEVTNGEYKKFIDATGYKAPPHWQNGTFESGKEFFPVVQVSWQDANQYAQWAGKRLPTEAEWEAAARGTDGHKYPWGNEPKSGAGNIGAGESGSIVAVGQFPDGKSPAGALDMIGNVWEWTADKVALYPGNTAKAPAEAKGKFRIIRGGAYDSDTTLDASYRGYVEEYRKDLNKTGFRCVKDAN